MSFCPIRDFCLELCRCVFSSFLYSLIRPVPSSSAWQTLLSGCLWPVWISPLTLHFPSSTGLPDYRFFSFLAASLLFLNGPFFILSSSVSVLLSRHHLYVWKNELSTILILPSWSWCRFLGIILCLSILPLLSAAHHTFQERKRREWGLVAVDLNSTQWQEVGLLRNSGPLWSLEVPFCLSSCMCRYKCHLYKRIFIRETRCKWYLCREEKQLSLEVVYG